MNHIFVQTNTSFNKTTKLDLQGEIVIPKPIRRGGFYWLNYVNSLYGSSSNILTIKNSYKYIGLLTREERKLKLQRFFEKRKRKHNIKKIKYQHRHEVADKRMRYKGRFVKINEAKELIIKGEEVTANDRSELDKLIQELIKNNLLEKCKEAKKVFTTIKENESNNGDRKFSLSTSSGTSPIVETNKDERVFESVPILNLLK